MKTISEISHRFEDMSSQEVYDAVNEAVTHIKKLPLESISSDIQTIMETLSPVLAAVALDMVTHATQEQLTQFLLSQFGLKCAAVKEAMISLNALLVNRVESNNVLNGILIKSGVDADLCNDQARKNIRLFISGIIGTASLTLAKSHHPYKDKLNDGELSIATSKYLCQFRQAAIQKPMVTTFSNECPITLQPITLNQGVMVISYNPEDAINHATVAYYSSQNDFTNAWKTSHQRCPLTRKTMNVSIPLSQLTQEQLLRLITAGGALQEDALGNRASYAKEFLIAQKEQPRPNPNSIFERPLWREPEIQTLITSNLITRNAVIALNREQQSNLIATQPLLSSNFITINVASGLNSRQRIILGDQNMIRLIQNNHITVNDAMNLEPGQAGSLFPLIKLILERILTVQEILTFTEEQQHNFWGDAMHTLLQEGYVTVNQIKNLSEEQSDSLKYTQRLISSGFLTVNEALALTPAQVDNLLVGKIVTLIQEHHLTIDEAKNLSDKNHHKLFKTQELISSGVLSVADALALHLRGESLSDMEADSLGLSVSGIRKSEEIFFRLIQEGTLTLEQAKTLSQEDIEGIHEDNVDTLLAQIRGQQYNFAPI